MPELYRKAALERISNPEQLDKALKVTSPLSWLALVAITVIIAVTGVWSVYGSLPTTITAPCQVVSPVSTNAIYATSTGTVNQLMVREGDRIEKGQVLMTIGEPGGEEKAVVSDQNGIVSEISVTPGGRITQNSEVLRLSPITYADKVVVAYVPTADVTKITGPDSRGFELGHERNVSENDAMKRGPEWLDNIVKRFFPQAIDDGTDDILITLSNIDSQEYGHMAGYILNIDSTSTSNASMAKVLGKDNNQSTVFAKDNIPVSAVTIGLHTEEGDQNKLYWSNDKGKDKEVLLGAQGTVRFIIDKEAPIEKLIKKIKEVWHGGDK